MPDAQTQQEVAKTATGDGAIQNTQEQAAPPPPGVGFSMTGAYPPVAADRPAAATHPTASELAFGDPTTMPKVTPTPDGTVTDAGALGQIAFSSASTMAQVTLAQPAEAAVLSADGGKPTFAISATVRLSEIQANGITPAQLAQITNVTILTGLGTAQFKLIGDAVVLTLAGAPSIKAFNASTFKLWLACGSTVALRIEASSFHTDISEWNRAGGRLQIAHDQQELALSRSDPSLSSYIPSDEQNLARDQQSLASDVGPDFVMLDSNGALIKVAPPTSTK